MLPALSTSAVPLSSAATSYRFDSSWTSCPKFPNGTARADGPCGWQPRRTGFLRVRALASLKRYTDPNGWDLGSPARATFQPPAVAPSASRVAGSFLVVPGLLAVTRCGRPSRTSDALLTMGRDRI